jgi:hypothetical protein
MQMFLFRAQSSFRRILEFLDAEALFTIEILCEIEAKAQSSRWFHPCGVTGGHRDYRSASGAPFASSSGCSRSCSSHAVLEQHQAIGPGNPQLRIRIENIPANDYG